MPDVLVYNRDCPNVGLIVVSESVVRTIDSCSFGLFERPFTLLNHYSLGCIDRSAQLEHQNKGPTSSS